jgi:hypothetical protein
MRIAHAAVQTYDLDGAKEFQRRTFGASTGGPYRGRRRLGFDSDDRTKPSLAALVRPLSRPFLPFGERSLFTLA